LVAAAACALAGCAPPQSFKQVARPRAGRALGGRVAIVYSERYQIKLGGLEKLHSFDIGKYGRIYLHLQTEGYLRPEEVFVPGPVTREEVLLVHTPAFVEGLRDPARLARWLELPIVALAPPALIDAGIVEAFRHATGGTILAGRLALRHGIAINLAGGYHHAMPEAGGGFNIFADLAIAARALRKEGLVRRVLFVDLDVHQGNGTAAIFAGDPDTFTFSMHQAHIYPIPKARGDLDVELAGGTGDEAYLECLSRHLPEVIRRARPDIVFFQAGCDTLAGDPLAGLEMTPRGVVRRDAMVIGACADRGLPVVMTLGGGYSAGAWAVQLASVRRTIGTYGRAGEPRLRKATAKEKLYTK
jgi:histone deacetylase 11